jgi:ATP synthase protein I
MPRISRHVTGGTKSLSATIGSLPATIGKIIALQVLVTTVASLVALVAGGAAAAGSAALGGAIGVIPSAAYGFLLIKKPYGTPRGLLQRQYVGEFAKLALTVMMFGASFFWVKQLSVLPFFATYILTLVVYWAALLLFA